MQGWFQIILFCAVLIAIVPLLGGYMARVFTYERVFLSRSRAGGAATYRVCASTVQSWKSYAGSLLVFSGRSGSRST